MYYEPQKNIKDLVEKEDNLAWGTGEIANVEYPYPKSYPEIKKTEVSIKAFISQIMP